MAKKVVLIVVGIVVLLCGLGGLVSGIGITAINGRNLDSGFHALATQTPALVSRTEKVTSSAPSGSGVGSVDITVSARSDSPVFLGIGRAAQVDAYLSDVAYDEVTDLRLSPYRVDTIRHAGTQPADPPDEESFWTASATGTSPTLTWRVTDGDYRIVVMNVDGSPGVVLQGQFGIKIGGIGGFGIGALIVGLLLVAGGIVLIVLGIRARRTPVTPAGTPGPYPPAYPPQSYPPPSYPPALLPPPPPSTGEPPPYGGPPSYRRRRPPANNRHMGGRRPIRLRLRRRLPATGSAWAAWATAAQPVTPLSARSTRP